MSDTTKIASLMTRPGVGMVKGQVTGKEDRNWLLYRSLGSFSIMTDSGEVLVTLPRTAKMDLEICTEVWVMGESLGTMRFHADMIFLPRLQQKIDLTKRKGVPSWSIATVILVGLMLLVWNSMLIMYYIGIPTVLAITAYNMQDGRPRLCSYEAWELIEQRSRKPDGELPQMKEEKLVPREVFGLLALCAWLLVPFTVSTFLVPFLWIEMSAGWIFSLSINVIILLLLIIAAVNLTIRITIRGGAG